MQSSLNHTMKAALNGVESAGEHALGTAKDAIESAKEGTVHTFASTMSALVKGVSAVSGIIATLRSLDVDDGLAWLGLARRTSPLRSAAIFTAGVAMGAGAGLLFAPMSGADLRRAILRGPREGNDAKATNGARSTADATESAEPRNGAG